MVALAAVSSPPALSDSSESNLNATGRSRRGRPLAVISESHPSGEPEPERSTNLATSQLASVCDHLSFTGNLKFVTRSLLSLVLSPFVLASSARQFQVRDCSLTPLVLSSFILASSARCPSVESARDGAGRGDAAGVCRAAPACRVGQY